jgi:hypothetical protein
VACGRFFTTLERVALHRVRYYLRGKTYRELVAALTGGVDSDASEDPTNSGRCDEQVALNTATRQGAALSTGPSE